MGGIGPSSRSSPRRRGRMGKPMSERLTWHQLAALTLWELRAQPCYCVSCAECRGSRVVSVRTGGYPEEELETCSTCRGSGCTEEACDRCRLLEDFDEDQP